MNRSSQKGGDGSTNVQAEQIIIHTGIDEKRAREIYHEMNLQLRSSYTEEALTIAKQRVAEFEEQLLPKIEKVDGALQAFADPSFQLLLANAQRAAASTERKQDYDLLAELMITRFQNGQNRVTRAGINLAVDIVDKISSEALLGLTTVYAVNTFHPLSGELDQGLDTLNGIFERLLYETLPIGQEWLDHLDVLGTVRLNEVSKLKSLSQFYSEIMHGYIDVGIQKNSDAHTKALDILKASNLPTDLLVDHALCPDFVRLSISNRQHLASAVMMSNIVKDGITTTIPNPLNDNQKIALNSIYDLYSQDGKAKTNNLQLFEKELDKRPTLKTLNEWWSSIPTGITITSVGKVLAHSNAQRCDNTLPKFK